MKNVTKEEWVVALRSGEYKQGPGALHRGDKFCCLGVLCDLSGGEWGYLIRPDESPDEDRLIANFYDHAFYPPSIINEAATDLSFNELITMNDGGYPFQCNRRLH